MYFAKFHWVFTILSKLAFVLDFIHSLHIDSCSSELHRHFDGHCNNEVNPDWGVSDGIFHRLTFPNYTDCLEMPRFISEMSRRERLPNSFDLSKLLLKNGETSHAYKTSMIALWAEFLSHDLYRANQTEDADGFFQNYECCDEHYSSSSSECYPINIPETSSLANSSKVSCINILRTPKAVMAKSGPREQLNTVTSVIDASQIYGATVEEAVRRRHFRRGQLKTMQSSNAETFFPTDSENICSKANYPNDCFSKYDVRMNYHPSLTSLYTLWLREHNRIAEHLNILNPCSTDEELYQQARAIVIAEIQHITYNEFLPLVLGRKAMKDNDLMLEGQGMPNESYDRSLPINILNEFSTAAFRSLRLFAQGIKLFKDPLYKLIDVRELRSNYFAPYIILGKGMLGNALRGAITMPMKKSGQYFQKAYTEIVYSKGSRVSVYDLLAIDIHRGRDHGIAGYNFYREVCGLGKVNSFWELTDFIDEKLVKRLNSSYHHVNDIDLFVGGILERPTCHSVFGPTFTCIIAEQFRRLKRGDRFWYETANQTSSFPLNQLRELRKSTLASIMCDNVEDMITIQPKVFVRPKSYNERVKCSSIPRVYLTHWKF